MKIRTLIGCIAIGLTMLLIAVIALPLNGGGNRASDKESALSSNPQPAVVDQASTNTGAPPRSSHTTASSLASDTPEEVARYAAQYVQASGDLRSGTAQVLLSRRVTAAEMPGLGLGCFSFASIEEPPLMLVILKGDIRPRVPGSQAAFAYASKTNYAAYVFDLWAGAPTLITTSGDGSRFRTALNDPALPTPVDAAPTGPCPTDAPKILHYGDYVPTSVPKPPTWWVPAQAPATPTFMPAPIRTNTAP